MESHETRFRESFPDAAAIEAFRADLGGWFGREGRDYPWRRTRDPYAILVSEVMLQQTQIATVLGRGYYERWLARFPNWEALARADEAAVLKAWEGLGYYNRARNLQRIARAVLEDHGGAFPRDPGAMLKLPGVGRYTAGALGSFAFNLSLPLVDGNVTRVLARLFGWEAPVDRAASQRALWDWAERLVPPEGGRVHNSALMELGQRLCTPASPNCPSCPARPVCRAASGASWVRIPTKTKRAASEKREERVGLSLRQGAVLLVEETGTRRRGLWRLPRLSEEECADLEESDAFVYAITRYRVTLRVYDLPPRLATRIAEAPKARWHAMREAASWPALGAPYSKAIRNRIERKATDGNCGS